MASGDKIRDGVEFEAGLRLTLLAVLALSSAQPPILLPAAAAVLGGGLSPSSRKSSSAPAAAARDLRGLPNLKFQKLKSLSFALISHYPGGTVVFLTQDLGWNT